MLAFFASNSSYYAKNKLARRDRVPKAIRELPVFTWRHGGHIGVLSTKEFWLFLLFGTPTWPLCLFSFVSVKIVWKPRIRNSSKIYGEILLFSIWASFDFFIDYQLNFATRDEADIMQKYMHHREDPLFITIVYSGLMTSC